MLPSPWDGKQLWDPTLLLTLFLLTQCNTSPARAPAESAVVSVVTVTASAHGYTKEQLLDKRENFAALTSARCFLKQGCLQGSRLSSAES